MSVDAAAVLLFPLPDPAFKFAAAKLLASDALAGELALDHHLRRDSGMIGAGQPERGFAFHSMPADSDVHHGVFEHVADVERPGDIGRRNDDGKHPALLSERGIRPINTGFNPPLSPVRLKALRLIDLLKLHGNFQRSIGKRLAERRGEEMAYFVRELAPLALC